MHFSATKFIFFHISSELALHFTLAKRSTTRTAMVSANEGSRTVEEPRVVEPVHLERLLAWLMFAILIVYLLFAFVACMPKGIHRGKPITGWGALCSRSFPTPRNMDQDKLRFHITSNDYFGTLATVLDLARQDLMAGHKLVEIAEMLAKERDDLLYLQEHCRIEECD